MCKAADNFVYLGVLKQHGFVSAHKCATTFTQGHTSDAYCAQLELFGGALSLTITPLFTVCEWHIIGYLCGVYVKPNSKSALSLHKRAYDTD